MTATTQLLLINDSIVSVEAEESNFEVDGTLNVSYVSLNLPKSRYARSNNFLTSSIGVDMLSSFSIFDSQKSFASKLTLDVDSRRMSIISCITNKEMITALPNMRFAVIIMLLSAAAYSLLGVFVQWADILGYSSMQPLIFRSFFQVATSMLFSLTDMNLHLKIDSSTAKNIYKFNCKCLYKEFYAILWEIPLKVYGYILVRSIISGSLLTMYFMSLTYISIGDAVAILSMYPVYTTLVAYFILKEKVTIVHGCAIVLCLIGLVFIAQPDFIFQYLDDEHQRSDESVSVHDEILGYSLIIISSFLMSFSFVFVRLAKDAPTEVIILAQGLVSVIIGMIVLFSMQKIRGLYTAQDFLCLIFIGFVGYFAQWSMTVAVKLMPAGISSMLRSTEIVWAYAWQILIFEIFPSLYTIIGACIILFGIGIVSYQKIVKSLNEIRDELVKDEEIRRFSINPPLLVLEQLNEENSRTESTDENRTY